MLVVVGDAELDAARDGVLQRSADDRVEVVGETDVVDRDIEGVLRGAQELGERVRGVGGRLAAVGQRADFDLSDALYAFLAAW